MKLRNAIAAVAAFAAITAPSTGAPAQSQTASGADIVTFGDSFVANPDQFKNFTRGIPATSIQKYAWDYPSREGCLQAPKPWYY